MRRPAAASVLAIRARTVAPNLRDKPLIVAIDPVAAVTPRAASALIAEIAQFAVIGAASVLVRVTDLFAAIGSAAVIEPTQAAGLFAAIALTVANEPAAAAELFAAIGQAAASEDSELFTAG